VLFSCCIVAVRLGLLFSRAVMCDIGVRSFPDTMRNNNQTVKTAVFLGACNRQLQKSIGNYINCVESDTCRPVLRTVDRLYTQGGDYRGSYGRPNAGRFLRYRATTCTEMGSNLVTVI